MSPSTKKYFLLTEPVPGHRIFDLIGRAVYIDEDSLKRPTESIMKPRLPDSGPDLKELEPDLYPTHVEAKSAEVLLEKAHNESAKASITKVLSLFYSHKKASRSKRTIPGFRRITMEEQHIKVENLLKKAEYHDPILEFFDAYPEARFGIIVSIISCYEMEVENQNSKEREGGGNLTAPGEAMGAPPTTGDTTLEGNVGGNTKVELSGAYKDEVIMACGYVEMRLKKRDSSLLFWKSHKPSPHDITFTTQALHPLTMTVSVPPTRIEGDQDAILGGITQGKGGAFACSDISDLSEQDDDGSDFVLYS
ncbi:Nn.00g062130.m01.CDS01 [Neocucurbitaria sp. VM-36]